MNLLKNKKIQRWTVHVMREEWKEEKLIRILQVFFVQTDI